MQCRPQSFAELMLLRAMQSVTRCLCFGWYDAFHKGE